MKRGPIVNDIIRTEQYHDYRQCLVMGCNMPLASHTAICLRPLFTSVVLSSVPLSLGLCGLHTFFAPSFFCPLFLSSLSTLPVLLLCPTACQRCPAGTEPVLGYEYKWWNVLPANMKTSCFNVGNNNCDGMNGERGLQWRALGARGRC